MMQMLNWKQSDISRRNASNLFGNSRRRISHTLQCPVSLVPFWAMPQVIAAAAEHHDKLEDLIRLTNAKVSEYFQDKDTKSAYY